MAVLEDVKVLLGISDTVQDELLQVIEKQTVSHFLTLSKQVVVPNELNYIIVDVVVKRYNRLGAEGLKSQRMEGLDLVFSLDDFADYDAVIRRFFPELFETGFKML